MDWGRGLRGGRGGLPPEASALEAESGSAAAAQTMEQALELSRAPRTLFAAGLLAARRGDAERVAEIVGELSENLESEPRALASLLETARQGADETEVRFA